MSESDNMERCISELLRAIEACPASGRRIVALDGRCASGKTTLAARLSEAADCTVFHVDDFFLRPEQRTEERLRTPGGNVDRERVLTEILLPLRSGAEEISYRPYDCASQTLLPPREVRPKRTVLIEGSYSCHPALWENYDLRVFLTVSPEAQLRRIERRNGSCAAAFRDRWIPLEEAYFRAYQIESRCALTFDTTQWF